MSLPIDKDCGSQPVRLLVVEDDEAYARVLSVRFSRMSSPTFQVDRAATLKEALSYLEVNKPEAVLLDMTLPDSRGFDTYRLFSLEHPELPVVVLSGFDDESLALECVRSGAQDYQVKGQFDFVALARFLRFAMERHRQQLRFKALSITDDLTGLYNRRGFFELGSHQIKIAERAERELLLFYFDLDGFKAINDQFGHAEGDAALKRMAFVLKDSFRSSDILARIGGDEFAVLALEASKQHGTMLSDRISEKLKNSNEAAQKRYALSMSVGQTCFYPKQAYCFETLLEAADRDLYACKKNRAAGSPA